MTKGNYFFAAAARSTKVLPPFILWASGASLIWITTASASTPRFFTSACVMSRIMPAFCSSVRPAAMLTVISGIFSLPLLLLLCVRHELDPHPEERPFGRVSKDGLIVPMVRDGATAKFTQAAYTCLRAPPHHEGSIPLHVMARQNFAHFGDDLAFTAGKLRRTGLAPFLVGGDRGGRLGALDQILD